MQKPLTRYWLLLGSAALAVAGLFAVVLVVARTPALAALPYFKSLFHQALVVHVDLSVLVWFLAIACLMWSRAAAHSRPFIPYMEEAALSCFALGTLAMTLSPFDTSAEALMSNYIPVIHSALFFLGLALIFCGVLLMLGKLLTSSPPTGEGIQFAVFSSAVITLFALAAFFWSFMQMPPVIDGVQYYELAFWGGGHVLQFTHTQIMMVCWLMLVYSFTQSPPPAGERGLTILFSIGPLAALLSPFIYLYYDITSQEHRQFFTHLMIWGNGIAPSLLALMLIPPLLHARGERRGTRRALWSSLVMSLLLFIYGGALGGMIEGQNVIIPAHYHGSIVGVTLAFMGFAYLMLPKFGYRDPAGWRLAYWQPIVYGAGQIMHISGLAWSGGYGVLRKTPGGMADLDLSVKAALGFMGLGGIIAITGGLLFVVVVWKCVRHPRRPVAP